MKETQRKYIFTHHGRELHHLECNHIGGKFTVTTQFTTGILTLPSKMGNYRVL